MALVFQKYDEGGPNDPRTAFNGLREYLRQVKEELSPWGWRAYASDYRERKRVENKLKALNKLPGSGEEPQDGVVEGTPLWQERLDKMLLVEHLKRKIMTAHNSFSDSSELMLQCHGWLVKDSLLADKFVECISHVPTSQYERVDVLMSLLNASRKETQDVRNEFEDYKITLMAQREKFLQKVSDHQVVQTYRRRCDDTMISWSYQVQREQVLALRDVRANLERRVIGLESALVLVAEDFAEVGRQWSEEKAALEQDRDKFKKLYNKMVKAHEQALLDLQSTQGTAEGQAKMIQVLSVEKTRLTEKVEVLEDDKRRMTRQLAELRDEVAKQRQEIRRLGLQSKGTERALAYSRKEAERLEDELQALAMRLSTATRIESQLRVDLATAVAETAAARISIEDAKRDFPAERRLRQTVELERDRIMSTLCEAEAELVRTVEECKQTVEAVKTKAAQDLEDFRTGELTRVKEEFQKKTDTIVRRNEVLEREVHVGDTLGPHLATLNPLVLDESTICAVCRKVIVYEGTIKG